MGGGDSKQEQNVNNIKKVDTPESASKNASKVPSPRGDYNQSKFKKDSITPGTNHINEAYIKKKQIQNDPQDQSQLPVQSYNSPQYFASWPAVFQQDNSKNVKIQILTIQPTVQIKNLKKKYSNHYAKISWQYLYVKKGSIKQTLLRFHLNEDGGFSLTFLLNQIASCLEGDEKIWQIICPYRTNDQAEKVGGYTCERIYESNQDNYNLNDYEQTLDVEVFGIWQQKPSISRASMKKLLGVKRMVQDLKNQKGFEYNQITKYFDAADNWTFSVLIEQKFNSFKSWIIQLQSEDPKQQQKIKAMSITLKNDVQTRESMYIEDMKKKRDIINDSSYNDA